MGVEHLAKVTKKDLERAGVSQRDYELMKKLTDLDPEMFIERYEVMVKSPTPFMYAVDISKYEGKKIAQELKETLFRPKKMKALYEKYWLIASELDATKKEVS
jgi:hypothetical protein